VEAKQHWGTALRLPGLASALILKIIKKATVLRNRKLKRVNMSFHVERAEISL
jgi:hypothetical protein